MAQGMRILEDAPEKFRALIVEAALAHPYSKTNEVGLPYRASRHSGILPIA